MFPKAPTVIPWSDPYDPDRPPVNPFPEDDEFDGTQLSSKWQLYNPGSIACNTFMENGALFLDCPYNIQNRVWAYLQPAPTGKWRIRIKGHFDCASQNFFGGGLMVRNVANNKELMFVQLMHSTYGYPVAFMGRLTGNTFNTEVPQFTCRAYTFYWELSSDGTTITHGVSASGKPGTFRQCNSDAIATHLGAAPDLFGVYIHPYNNNTADANWGGRYVFEWFRRIE